MLTPQFLSRTFESASSYDAYLAAGDPKHAANWRDFEKHVALTPAQRTLIGGFERDIRILAVSGIWCGDCVQQLPFLPAIAAANPDRIQVRFIERDQHLDVAEQVVINGGLRVPVVIFMNEDFEFVSLFGDRSLARYRALAARKLGAACPLPGAPVPPDEVAATLADWVGEVERVHLLLRLSTKLRQRYGD